MEISFEIGGNAKTYTVGWPIVGDKRELAGARPIPHHTSDSRFMSELPREIVTTEVGSAEAAWFVVVHVRHMRSPLGRGGRRHGTP